MKSPKPPAAPTAAQLAPTVNLQTQSNVDTAAAQAALNNVNQVTPYGNVTYRQTGTTGTGASAVPTWTATTTLSPAEQAFLARQNKIQISNLDTATGVAGQAAKSLSTPFNLPKLDLSNPAVGAQIAALYNPRLDTQWSQNYNALQSDLANRGVRMGSEAYDRAMQQFQQGKNDAYNQVMIDAQSQAANEMLQQHSSNVSDITQQRDQPLNELAALQSGSQVQAPQPIQTPQTGIPSTNVIQQSQNQYNASLNTYNAQLQQQNAMMGGLAGLGSSLLGGWAMSDRRLKEDVKKAGKLNDGTAIYSFRYKGHPLQSLGLMAQEVEKKYPEAVAETPSGYKAVDYSRVAERVAA